MSQNQENERETLHSIVDEDPEASDYDGPAECEAGAEECETDPGQRDGEVDESQFDVMDEIIESMPVEPLFTPLADDGLPDHSVDGLNSAAFAPPFTYENVLCVADDRHYVPLTDEELLADGWTLLGPWALPPDTPLGRVLSMATKGFRSYGSKFNPDGSEASAVPRIEAGSVFEAWGHKAAKIGGRTCPVRPIRPACEHYQVQVFNNDDEPDPDAPGHNIVFRVCTHPSRRSVGGAAMSLSNQAIYHCSLRSPQDPESAHRQEEKDREKLQNKEHLVMVSMFGDVSSDETSEGWKDELKLEGIFK